MSPTKMKKKEGTSPTKGKKETQPSKVQDTKSRKLKKQEGR